MNGLIELSLWLLRAFITVSDNDKEMELLMRDLAGVQLVYVFTFFRCHVIHC